MVADVIKASTSADRIGGFAPIEIFLPPLNYYQMICDDQMMICNGISGIAFGPTADWSEAKFQSFKAAMQLDQFFENAAGLVLRADVHRCGGANRQRDWCKSHIAGLAILRIFGPSIFRTRSFCSPHPASTFGTSPGVEFTPRQQQIHGVSQDHAYFGTASLRSPAYASQIGVSTLTYPPTDARALSPHLSSRASVGPLQQHDVPAPGASPRRANGGAQLRRLRRPRASVSDRESGVRGRHRLQRRSGPAAQRPRPPQGSAAGRGLRQPAMRRHKQRPGRYRGHWEKRETERGKEREREREKESSKQKTKSNERKR
eukprot:scaffold10_cov257-Pinguiococcus_pyrenoidosus.AAC.39